MSRVFFASTRVRDITRESTLPGKFLRVLNRLDLERSVKKKKVAIKMHLGGGYGYTTIHPLFARMLVDTVKEGGGKPFITDTPGGVNSAHERGYTREVLGAPLYPATGPKDNSVYRRRHELRTCDVNRLHEISG